MTGLVDDIQTPRNTTVTDDGYIVDTDTGEVLSMPAADHFTVTNENGAAWVFSRFLDAESEMAAVDSSAEVLRAKAVLQNAESIREGFAHKLKWLHMRFDADMAEFARKQLEGKKERTWKTVLGSVSLRLKKGGVRVANDARAVEIARAAFPHAIKRTEKFLISEMDPAVLAAIDSVMLAYEPEAAFLGVPADNWRDAFKREPDSETVSIKTGVG